MSGRTPDEIWEQAVVEGERRLCRTWGALVATGFVGGADIMMGVLALTAVSGALGAAIGIDPAHVVGSLFFGLGFLFLIVGRGELFTENFLIPVGAVAAGKGSIATLLRLWGITFVANYVGIAVLAYIMSRHGVLPETTLRSAGRSGDILAARGFVASALSGVLAGTVMTLMTWLTHAVERDTGRMVVTLAIGFVIAIVAMNHAVVGFGEMVFAAMAGTLDASTWEFVRTILAAIAGNLVGGLGLVTVNRLVQARGEPG